MRTAKKETEERMQGTVPTDVLFCFTCQWLPGNIAIRGADSREENRGANPEINVVVVVHITHWYTLSSHTCESIATSVPYEGWARSKYRRNKFREDRVQGRERRIVLFASCGLHRPHLRFLSVLFVVFRSSDVLSVYLSISAESRNVAFLARRISLVEASTTAVRLWVTILVPSGLVRYLGLLLDLHLRFRNSKTTKTPGAIHPSFCLPLALEDVRWYSPWLLMQRSCNTLTRVRLHELRLGFPWFRENPREDVSLK